MRTFGALAMLGALAYLVWRVQTRRAWIERVEAARVQRLWWRRAAIVSVCLLATIGAVTAQRLTPSSVVHVVESGERR